MKVCPVSFHFSLSISAIETLGTSTTPGSFCGIAQYIMPVLLMDHGCRNVQRQIELMEDTYVSIREEASGHCNRGDRRVPGITFRLSASKISCPVQRPPNPGSRE